MSPPIVLGVRPFGRFGEPGWLLVTQDKNAIAPCQSVGRLTSVGGDRYGACIRVSREWILTAHHVVDIADLGGRFKVKFGFLKGGAGDFEYDLDPASGFFPSNDGIQGPRGNLFDLDYVFIRIKEPFTTSDPSAQPQFIPRAVAPTMGSPARIAQLIDGEPLRMEIPDQREPGAGTLTHLDSEYLYHRCSTDPGTSGSPVFDASWRLIGIHTHGWLDRAPLPLRRENNWGTRIGRIVADASQRGFDFQAIPTLRTLLP